METFTDQHAGKYVHGHHFAGGVRTRVLIIGAAGLIGRQLTRAVMAQGVGTLRLADRVPVPLPSNGLVRVESHVGDFCDEAFARRMMDGVNCVFHLAALLATESEADLHRGLAVNLVGLLQLLRLCEEASSPPRLLYASSVAAFGGALPEVVDDNVARTPQTSYGTQKAIAELLIGDYTRRGLIDGRVLRLPIVLVRNGPPSSAVSDRVAALVREPLLGRDVACGLRPDTRMAVTSAQHAAAAFHSLAHIDAGSLGQIRTMNLPSLSVTAAELAQAVVRAPVAVRGLITWMPDPALQTVVDGWPRRFDSVAARALGLATPDTADSIVASFVAENGLH